MPYTLNLSGVRGDALLIAVPLYIPGSPARPVTVDEAQAIKDAWPNIEMQVRAKASDNGSPLLSLTSGAGQLSIELSYPQPSGPNAPVLLIKAAASVTNAVIKGVYDIQFSGPNDGPYTWLGGEFSLVQDVTRVSTP